MCSFLLAIFISRLLYCFHLVLLPSCGSFALPIGSQTWTPSEGRLGEKKKKKNKHILSLLGHFFFSSVWIMFKTFGESSETGVGESGWLHECVTKMCVVVFYVCRKHYREYLVSLINAHSLDPAALYDAQELTRACERYQVDTQRGESEDDKAYHTRLLVVR